MVSAILPNQSGIVMFLKLAHQNLEVYKVTRKLVVEVYRITQMLPDTEKFGMISQMRRAATSSHLNSSEGCTRKSKNERARFFEIARGSVVELDTAAGTVVELNYLAKQDLEEAGVLIVQSYKLISGMINEIENNKSK